VLPSDAIPDEWGDGSSEADVHVVRGDVTKPTSVAGAMRGVATVFHPAAMVGDWGAPETHELITVRGTEHVLTEAARGGAHALLASSVVVYGDAIGKAVCDEHRPFGKILGPYSRSKQAQENIAQRLEGSDGLKVTVIRPTNVYGPGSVPWVDKAVAELHKGSPMLIDGGRRAAGLTFVDNVVDVFVRAAERPGTVGRVYNANDDNGITWLRYFTELAKLCGAAPPKSIPGSIARIAAYGLETGFRIARRTERPPITHEALNLVGSHHRVPIIRAQRELGYSPLVSYSEGMKAVAAYLEETRR
jgi:nucleoside-diphosphate-sugar epimerase